MITKGEQEAMKLVDDWAHDFRISLDPQDDDYWALVRQFSALLEQRTALIAACKLALEATGGSKHWNGQTAEFLHAMEVALTKERVTA